MNQLQASIDPALLGVEESIVGYKKDMIEPLIILPKKDLVLQTQKLYSIMPSLYNIGLKL